MIIKDIMTDNVDLIGPDTTLREAATHMRERDVGFLPVGDGDQLQGTVTDRDIVVKGIAAGANPDDTDVRKVMAEAVLYCYEDQSPEDVATNMGEQQVRRMLVVNRDKRLVGVVSLGDLSHCVDVSISGRTESGVTAGRAA